MSPISFQKSPPSILRPPLQFGRQHCPLDSLSLPTSLEKLQLEGGLGPNNAGWQGPLEKILKTGVR